jgi:hypothetical protein
MNHQARSRKSWVFTKRNEEAEWNGEDSPRTGGGDDEDLQTLSYENMSNPLTTFFLTDKSYKKMKRKAAAGRDT